MFFLKSLPTQAMLESYRARYPAMDTGAVGGALALLRRASLLMRELDAYFAGHGLSQTRFLTLIVIDREPDRAGLLPSEIAERLDVSRPVVTETIKALIAAGLLHSSPSKQDRRAKQLSLTAGGQEVLQGLLPGYFALIGRFMEREGQAGERG